MEVYKILNSIKPRYFKTTYPYNLVDPEKIAFTKKKVKILAKEINEKPPKKTKDNAPATTPTVDGGNQYMHAIKFYG